MCITIKSYPAKHTITPPPILCNTHLIRLQYPSVVSSSSRVKDRLRLQIRVLERCVVHIHILIIGAARIGCQSG